MAGMTQIRANQILDGILKDAKIAADANIALSKLAEVVLQADGGQELTADWDVGGTFKITGLPTATADGDAASKSYVDQALITGGVVKEALLDQDQLSDTYGILPAMVCFITTNPQDGDTIVITDGTNTETYTYKTTTGVATDIEIGATPVDTMTNAAAVILAQSSYWNACYHADGLDAINADGVNLISVRTGGENSTTRIYGSWGTQANMQVVEYAGELEYRTSKASIDLPSSDPGSGRVGIGRLKANLDNGEIHLTLDSDGLYSWDGDGETWRTLSGTGSIPDATAASGGGTKGKLTVDSDNGLSLSTGVLSINTATARGLDFVSDQLSIALDSSDALELAAGGIDLKDTITGDRTFSANSITLSGAGNLSVTKDNASIVTNDTTGVASGEINIKTGDITGAGNVGDLNITGGQGDSGNGGDINIESGNTSSGAIGGVLVSANPAGAEVAVAASIKLDAAADKTLLTAQPTGGTALAIATTNYVDTAVGALSADKITDGDAALEETYVDVSTSNQVKIRSGLNASGASPVSAISLTVPSASSGSTSGDIEITAGSNSVAYAAGGNVNITAGAGTGGSSTGGSVNILGGTGVANDGSVEIDAGVNIDIGRTNASIVHLGNSSSSITLQAAVNDVRLLNAPTGAQALAVATTGYVDTAISSLSFSKITDGDATTDETYIDVAGTENQIKMVAGIKSGAAAASAIDISVVTATSGDGGAININSGAASSANQSGGDINITSGSGAQYGAGGDITIKGGDTSGSVQGGGNIIIQGGNDANNGSGGNVTINAGGGAGTAKGSILIGNNATNTGAVTLGATGLYPTLAVAPPDEDSSLKIASTAWVQNEISDLGFDNTKITDGDSTTEETYIDVSTDNQVAIKAGVTSGGSANATSSIDMSVSEASAGDGGTIALTGGNTSGNNQAGGNVELTAGNSSGDSGSGGSIYILPGQGTGYSPTKGFIEIGNATSGDTSILSGGGINIKQGTPTVTPSQSSGIFILSDSFLDLKSDSALDINSGGSVSINANAQLQIGNASGNVLLGRAGNYPSLFVSPVASDSSTKIATTAWVQGELTSVDAAKITDGDSGVQETYVDVNDSENRVTIKAGVTSGGSANATSSIDMSVSASTVTNNGGSITIAAGDTNAPSGKHAGDISISAGANAGSGDGGDITLTSGTGSTNGSIDLVSLGNINIGDGTGGTLQVNVDTQALALKTSSTNRIAINDSGFINIDSAAFDLDATGTVSINTANQATPPSIVLTAGNSTGAGNQGADVSISSGNGGTSGSGGNISIAAGSPGASGAGGSISITTGDSSDDNTSTSSISLSTGDANGVSGSSGDIDISTGNTGTSGIGGNITISATAGSASGGDLTLSASANKAVLDNQPTGTVDLAIATTKYVDDQLGSTGIFVDKEVPTGTINGTNRVFTLANTPAAGSEHVYLNGLLQLEGSGNDYQISGTTITFEVGSEPLTGSNLQVTYRK